VLAHAANRRDAAVFESRRNLGRGRLQRFLLLAEPDGFHDVARDSFGQAAGYGFNFGKFGHGISRTKINNH
jgi:hypothetical protein